MRFREMQREQNNDWYDADTYIHNEKNDLSEIKDLCWSTFYKIIRKK